MHTENSKTAKLKNQLIELAQTRQFKKIIKIYQRNKDKKISDIDIWNIFAGANSELNRFSDVRLCCQKIINISPDNYQALFNLALAQQQLNDYENAINNYEKCISINKSYFNALANCAHLYQITGNYNKAIRYYEDALKLNDNNEVKTQYAKALTHVDNKNKAIKIYNELLVRSPGNDKARFYLAQLYYENQDYIKAEKEYTYLYKADMDNVNVVNNLGRLYEQTGNLDKALEFYERAIKIDKNLAVIHRNIGRTLITKGKATEDNDLIRKSITYFTHSTEIEPEHPEAYFELGKIYNHLGDISSATIFFTKALEMDLPDDFDREEEFTLAAKYFLASVSTPETFGSEKKDFVAGLFDDYAENFDKNLVEDLEYQTPLLISNALSKYIDKDKKYNILDLGCGTGLCAPYLSEYSKQLTGIDLSEKMIKKAQSLNIYTDLIVGEISEEVAKLDNIFDIITAADVFVYIGGLSDVFATCNEKLTASGLFVFSTEKHLDDEEDYRLYESGRHKHSIKYLNTLIEKYGFILISHEECELRKDFGVPVTGTITIAKKL